MSCVVAHLNDNFDRDFPRFPRPDEGCVKMVSAQDGSVVGHL